MATEIERKFLVADEGWRAAAEKARAYRQAYLAVLDKMSARIRIIEEVEATLTIKSAEAGMSRAEFEYRVPVADARDLLKLCTGLVIEKRRHIVMHAGHRWEVDVFSGALDGLVIAEIELDAEDTAFALPPWLGREITHDKRYYNASLAQAGRPADQT